MERNRIDQTKTHLYLVTDRTLNQGEKFLKVIEEALEGGVTILQLREKNITTAEYISLAREVKKLSKKYNVPLIIDDRVDVCLAADCDGVHLGAEDMSIKEARQILGDNKIVGATAKTVSSAIKAQEDGADYLGVGAIYPTKTKVKTVITKVETLKDITNNIKIPAFAIGGLNQDNLDILKGSGAKGICIVRAVMESEDPKEMARSLKRKAEDILID